MRRRDLIPLLGAVVAADVARRAAGEPLRQPRRIAFVHSSIPAEQLIETGGTRVRWIGQFFQELRRLGDFDGLGGNLIIDRCSGEGHSERHEDLARRVVAGKPELIVTVAPLIPAFRAAGATMPIVGFVGDPIRLGFAESLSRPGGNITGASIDAGVEVYGKQIQLLKEAVLTARRVGYLATVRVWDTAIAETAREAARTLGISLVPMVVPEVTGAQLRKVFHDTERGSLDGVVVSPAGELLASIELVVELARLRKLPAMYAYREYVEAGGLMAYAPELNGPARHLARQVHEILNGKRPGEIPIFQVTKFELVINMKTATALGVTVPPSLLMRADEVIE